MTTWTNTTQNTTSWSNSSKSVEQSYLLLEDSFEMLLEDGFNILLETEGTGTIWSNETQNTTSWNNETKN